MPRPGPRPYECVRRAWHSERHQPMRGSLIQEIFRVVNEIHSTATKKNKEWQEKLPVVVLKSEEIMYSKANSEAEYVDLKTLMDRTTDAINTIIRRDESAESGELLPPCIEAALNLGCMPRRTSRSQRNNNPRCYLNTGIPDPSDVENVAQGFHSQGMVPFAPLMNQTFSATQNLVNGCTKKFPFASQNVPSSSTKQFLTMETYTSSSSVYPLYYGTCFKTEETPHGIENLHSPPTPNNTRPAMLGMNPSTILAQRYRKETPDYPHDCDLSLRLGPFSVPSPNLEHNQQEQVKYVSCCSLEGNKISGLERVVDKQLVFVSQANVTDALDTCSSQWSVEGNVDAKMRKRKGVSAHVRDDEHFGWQSKHPRNQLTGQAE